MRCVFNSPRPSQRTWPKRKAFPNEIASVSFLALTFPTSSSRTSDGTRNLFSPPLRIAVNTSRAQRGRRPQGEACLVPYSDTRRRPNCRVRGAACSPCLQSRPDPGPLSRSLNGDADPAPPPACSPPHDSDTQNPRHTAAAAALCAPTRPGPARGEGGAGALGEPGGTPRHRCERGATPVAHSLDEVAGALLREALLPAAGQVCGNPRKVVKVGPPRRAPLGGPARPRPARPTGAHLSGSCGPS